MILSISGKIGSGKDTTGKIMQILIDNPHFVNNAIKSFLKRESLKPTFNIEKWANALKDITCILLGCTKEQLENANFKEKALGEEWIRYSIANGFWSHSDNNPSHKMMDSIQCTKEKYEEEVKINWQTAYKTEYSPRLLLQHIGTELFRNQILDNIWVNALMSKYKPQCKTYCARQSQPDDASCPHELDCDCIPNWIITDTRFPNEHKAVIDKGGINIRVNRPKERELILRNAHSIVDTRKTLEPEHESETALDNATFDYTIENDGTLDELIDKVRNLLEILKLI